MAWLGEELPEKEQGLPARVRPRCLKDVVEGPAAGIMNQNSTDSEIPKSISPFGYRSNLVVILIPGFSTRK